MNLSISIKKAIAIVSAIALVITSISFGPSSVGADDGKWSIESATVQTNTNKTQFNVTVKCKRYDNSSSGSAYRYTAYLDQMDEDHVAIAANGYEFKNVDSRTFDTIYKGKKTDPIAPGETHKIICAVYLKDGDTYTFVDDLEYEFTLPAELPTLSEDQIRESISKAEAESIKKAEEESIKKAAEADFSAKNNVAKGKQAFLSWTPSKTEYIGRLVDGDTGSYTHNSTDKGVNDYFGVDLGAEIDINAVVIKWEASAAKKYDIYVAGADGVYSETPVASAGTDNVFIIKTTFESVKAQYVKIVQTEESTNSKAYGINVYELAVLSASEEEPTTTEEVTTTEEPTVDVTTTEIVTTTEADTTEEVTTTEADTTEEVTTTEADTTEEVTTTEEATTTEEVTTTEVITTTEADTTEEVTTTEVVTTTEADTTEEVTTTEEATTTEVITTTEEPTTLADPEPIEVFGQALIFQNGSQIKFTWEQNGEQMELGQVYNVYIDGVFYKTYTYATVVAYEFEELGNHTITIKAALEAKETEGVTIDVNVEAMATTEEVTTTEEPTTTEAPTTTPVVTTQQVTTPSNGNINMDKNYSGEKDNVLGNYSVYTNSSWGGSKAKAGVDLSDPNHIKVQLTEGKWTEVWSLQVKRSYTDLVPGAKYEITWNINSLVAGDPVMVYGNDELVILKAGEQQLKGTFVVSEDGKGYSSLGLGYLAFENIIEFTEPTVVKIEDPTTTAAQTTTTEEVTTTVEDATTEAPTDEEVTTAKPLAKTKVKKASKKLSAKKVSLSFGKVKGAKKYTVQFSTKKNFKKVLYKATVKYKATVTVSNKKLAKVKVLYVRVKADKAVKWSAAKRIKVSK